MFQARTFSHLIEPLNSIYWITYRHTSLLWTKVSAKWLKCKYKMCTVSLIEPRKVVIIVYQIFPSCYSCEVETQTVVPASYSCNLTHTHPPSSSPGALYIPKHPMFLMGERERERERARWASRAVISVPCHPKSPWRCVPYLRYIIKEAQGSSRRGCDCHRTSSSEHRIKQTALVPRL